MTQRTRRVTITSLVLAVGMLAAACSSSESSDRPPVSDPAPTSTTASSDTSTTESSVTSAAATDGAAPTPDGEITIRVDDTLQPAYDALPGFDDGADRPVAAVTGDNGEPAMFVANEIWVSTDDRAQLDALVQRHDATIVAEIDPEALELEGLMPQYLLRVDAEGVDTAQLSEDLALLDLEGSGDYAVSSDDGLALLALVAAEERSEATPGGTAIGINWVGQPDVFEDRATEEAPVGDSLEGTPYDPNAFLWPSHSAGDDSRLDIGVAEAWRALEAAGQLNPIKLAILDMGFQPDADWSDDLTAISNVPFTDAIGTKNLLDCSTSDCPWHGTNAYSAAMALPDNGYGSAGPGGPVADPIVVFTTYDMFTSIRALTEARRFGARIANMSYGAGVPWFLSHYLIPFDIATVALRSTGMLIFASAGNDSDNVDSEGCTFRICFERKWYTPCENSGVICVGGTRGITADLAVGSNYGSEHVDIFAPFKLWVGPDPENPDNRAQEISGTSFSSPFAAGVAALIWAADPGLSADEVEDIMMRTAHGSPDDDVSRYVNAFAAVREVLGNINPELTLISPSDGRDIQLNEPVQLRVNVSDFEDGGQSCCDVVWTDRDRGQIATGTDAEIVFDETGEYVLTATATDRGGATSRVTTTIQVLNTPPVMTIANPRPGAEVFAGVPFTVQGTSFDINEAGPLDCGALAWSTDIAADGTAAGCETTLTLDELGPRQLTLIGRDPQLEAGTATVDIVVVAPPDDRPPTVQILEPVILANVLNAPTNLVGTATDPEGDENLTYQWTLTWPYDRDTGTGDNVQVIGNSASFVWEPRDTIPAVGGSQDLSMILLLELRATDSSGNSSTAAIELRLTQIN
jgi:hypothetical protein